MPEFRNPFEEMNVSVDSPPEELMAALKEADKLFRSYTPEELRWAKEYAMEKVGITEEDEQTAQLMIGTFMQVVERLNEPGLETEEVFGLNDMVLQMFFAYLVTYAANVKDLEEMNKNQAYAVGVIMGLAHGIQITINGVGEDDDE